MLTPTQYVSQLIGWLLHYPTPALIDEVMGVMAAEINDDAGPKWRTMRNALNSVVEDRWDTALLIAHTLLDARVSGQLQRTLSALKFQILSNQEERVVATHVFLNSELKSLLLSGGTQRDVVNARTQFLNQFVNELTTRLLFPRRVDLYRLALSQTKIHPAAWLPYKRYEEKNGADDYWSEAYMRLHVGFHRVLPQNLSAFLVRLIKHEIIKSVEFYNRVELSAD